MRDPIAKLYGNGGVESETAPRPPQEPTISARVIVVAALLTAAGLVLVDCFRAMTWLAVR